MFYNSQFEHHDIPKSVKYKQQKYKNITTKYTTMLLHKIPKGNEIYQKFPFQGLLT
jgi:hypothetical protein